MHTGHIRTWTMLHRLLYPCLLARLNMRLLMLVQPGELQGCARICAMAGGPRACECRTALHERAFQHRNLATYADGSASILYAHSDTYINLVQARKLLLTRGRDFLSPRAGMQGSNYLSTASRCHRVGPALEAWREWFWHLDSKPLCVKASGALLLPNSSALGGEAGRNAWRASMQCCYSWMDIAYIPRHAHRAFAEAARIFHDVQLEVAFPTIFLALQTAKVAGWTKFDCPAAAAPLSTGGGHRPSHVRTRSNLEVATLKGVPPKLQPRALCKASSGTPAPSVMRHGSRGADGRRGGGGGVGRGGRGAPWRATRARR